MNLKVIVDDKLKGLYGDEIPEMVRNRLKEELDLITKLGIEYQYILAYKISEKAKADGRIMIDRICGTSYIAFLLGITFVDPIKYYIHYEKITFDLDFASDYFPIIFEYTKEICKEQNIIIETLDDLKKHNIYLNTLSICSKLESLALKTNKKLQDITLDDSKIYEVLLDKNTTLLESGEIDIIKCLQDINYYIESIQDLAVVVSLGRSTISDKLNIIYPMMHYPKYKEDIYVNLKRHGIEKPLAYEIMNFISKGKHHYDKDKWNYYISIMNDKKIDDDYISWCSKIHYLYSKAYSYNRAIIYSWLAHYKIYYPKIYEEVNNL